MTLLIFIKRVKVSQIATTIMPFVKRNKKDKLGLFVRLLRNFLKNGFLIKGFYLVL